MISRSARAVLNAYDWFMTGKASSAHLRSPGPGPTPSTPWSPSAALSG